MFSLKAGRSCGIYLCDIAESTRRGSTGEQRSVGGLLRSPADPGASALLEEEIRSTALICCLGVSLEFVFQKGDPHICKT